MPNPSSFVTAQEIFRTDVIRNLYEEDVWLKEARDHSDSAIGNVVSLTNRGKTRSVINKATVALTPAGHGDTKKSYNIDEYQTIPTTLSWSNEMMVNYAMREEVMYDHNMQIRNDLAERTLVNWSASHTLLTSGAVKNATIGTGTRKKQTYADWLRLATYLTKQRVPNDGRRCAVVSADALADLLSIPEFISLDYINPAMFAAGTPVMTALVGKIAGFKIYVRSRTVVKEIAVGGSEGTHTTKLWLEDNSLTDRAIGATASDTIVAWHPRFVSTAISPDTLVSIVPAHGGHEISITAIAGGSRLSLTGVGVITMSETVVS